MSFRDDMYENISTFDKDDLFPTNVQDSIIKKSIKYSKVPNISYDISTGDVSRELEIKEYQKIEMYYKLFGYERLYNHYIDKDIDVSDEEGSGNFKGRAKLMQDRIKEIKSSPLYISTKATFVCSTF